MNVIQEYLDQSNITRYKISKISGINASTLKAAADSKNGIDGLTGKVIKAIALALNRTPGTILDEMITLEAIIMSFNENYRTYLMTTIWNKDDSIFSDEVVEYDDFSEALSDLESNVKTNKINERITYDLTIANDDDTESIVLSIELENNIENVNRGYVDNLELLPDALRNGVRKVAVAHAIKID